MRKSHIGLIGLAVMGENLALNLESRGYTVSVFNRSPERVEKLMAGRARGKNIRAAASLEALAAQLETPRRVLLMVKAGRPVDDLIDQLIPLLAPGDIIIDGGNSHFADTARRQARVEAEGLLYVGAGISGGEEGALHGPAIMPGGSPAAWPHIGPMLQAAAARAGETPCCQWVGPGGAGHYVKMVHNGIEYGDMQLIGEAYHLLRDLLGMAADEMQAIFARWNAGELNSYLIEITGEILGCRDGDGRPLVDKILDAAGQKGTGKWTAAAALDAGVNLSLIGEAVFARCLSAARDERVAASAVLAGPAPAFEGDRAAFVEAIGQALFAAKLVSYAQGFALLRAASEAYGWELDLGQIALLWRGGCIIRSAFLEDIKGAFDKDAHLPNLLLDGYFSAAVGRAQAGWRTVCAEAARHGIPLPALYAALAYYDGYRCASLPANLLQAQRDYFGAHTYERIDAPRGRFFHTNWTGQGGDTSASTYQV